MCLLKNLYTILTNFINTNIHGHSQLYATSATISVTKVGLEIHIASAIVTFPNDRATTRAGRFSDLVILGWIHRSCEKKNISHLRSYPSLYMFTLQIQPKMAKSEKASCFSAYISRYFFFVFLENLCWFFQ